MLRALVRGGHQARPRRGHLDRRDQRRVRGGRPGGRGRAAGRPVAGRVARQAFSETVFGPGGPAGPLRHPPARDRAAAQAAGRHAARWRTSPTCSCRSTASRPASSTPRARWFTSGPIVPAVLASCAVPGLLPPVEVDGEHYFDGGLVDSIPVGRAVALGASTVYVLHVGRIESPLTVPRRPWEVGLVAFEIARRHRFHEEMSAAARRPVHVLPTGGDRRPPDLRQFRYRGKNQVRNSIERAYAASARYLAQVAGALTAPPAPGGAPMLPPTLVRRLLLAPLVDLIAGRAESCWPRRSRCCPSLQRAQAAHRPAGRAAAAGDLLRARLVTRRPRRCSSFSACGSPAGSAGGWTPSRTRPATTGSCGGSSTWSTGRRTGRAGCG